MLTQILAVTLGYAAGTALVLAVLLIWRRTLRRTARPRIRTAHRRRALAEAIVRLREAGVAGITQTMGGEDDELAKIAGRQASDDIIRIVGRRRPDRFAWIVEHKVRVQASRRIARSGRAHDAMHRGIVLQALRSMPSDLLELVIEGNGPRMGVQCSGHVFELDPDTAATEARRILDRRRTDPRYGDAK